MSKAYGRKKGNKFENQICKEIASAFKSLGVEPQDVYRSVQSGAHAKSFGDISMSKKLAKLFPFAPECKCYQNVDMYELFRTWKKIKKDFRSWWIQTLRGAAKCKQAPILIFKGNGKPVLCAVKFSSLQKLHPAIRNKLKEIHYMVIQDEKGSKLWIGDWSFFLKICVRLRKK